MDSGGPIPYKELPNKRQKKLREFAYSEELPGNFAVFLASAMPRWHLVRCLYIDRSADEWYKGRDSDAVGPVKGIRARIRDTILTATGKCPVTDRIFASVRDPAVMMVEVLRALLRTVVYLAKFKSCANNHRLFIRIWRFLCVLLWGGTQTNSHGLIPPISMGPNSNILHWGDSSGAR